MFKNLFKKYLFAVALLLMCSVYLCHAQNADIHLSVLFQNVPPSAEELTRYDVEVSWENGSCLLQYEYNNNPKKYRPSIITGIPAGKVKIEVLASDRKKVLPFCDSILLHEGVNPLFIELESPAREMVSDISEFMSSSKDQKQNSMIFGGAKPKAPRVVREDGKTMLVSPLFLGSQFRSADEAMEAVLKFPGVRTDSNGSLVLSDKSVHWTWKGGALIFWKD